MAYTPPVLNAVNFALTSFTPEVLVGADSALSVYSAPAMDAVNFVLSVFGLPSFPSVDFELEEAPPGDYFGILKYWTGAIWNKAILKVNSGGWVAKPLYYWDGSAWREIDVYG